MKRGRKSKYFNEGTFESKWNVALYIRLSVQDGDKAESNSIVNQKELLDMFLKNKKELIFYNYYIDDGFSGTNFERPAFKKMMEDVELGLVNTIIVKDISRLGRNFIEMGNLVQNIFLVKNIRFISVCDNLDSFANPKSIENIFFPLKNLLNEMYCRDISTKITKAFNIMKKEGKFIGSYPPFGYLKENGNKHHLIIDNASATVVKMIFDLCESGIGNTLIAKELNERCILTPSEYRCKILNLKSTGKKVSNQWTPSIVGKILDNRVYSGDLVQSKYKNISYKVHKQIKNKEEEWIVVENTHEPIIDRDTYDKVQKAILERDTKMNIDGKISIFAGHIKCADCERAMSKKTAGKYKGEERNYYYYMCSTYMRSGGTKCSKHTIKNNDLEKAVLESIKIQIALVSDLRRIKNDIDNSNFMDNEKHLIQENIEKCEEKIEIKRKLRKECYEDWKLGKITEEEYNEYTNEYSSHIRKIEDNIDNYYRALKDLEQASAESEWMEYFIKYKNINSLSRELIDNLIDNIYIYEGNKIRIKFKYEDEYNYLLDFIKRRKSIIA